jgi:hypothetical protein
MITSYLVLVLLAVKIIALGAIVFVGLNLISRFFTKKNLVDIVMEHSELRDDYDYEEEDEF